MVEINLPNFVTVALIAIVAVVLVRLATKQVGVSSPV